MATLIAVYANISFAYISGIGWGWAGVIWLYSLIFYIPLDIIKFTVRYALSGEAWNLVFDRKVSELLHMQLVLRYHSLMIKSRFEIVFHASHLFPGFNRLLLLLRKITGRKIGQLSGFFPREVFKV